MKRLFDTDPVTKTSRVFHWNESDESFHIETLQNVSDTVELTQAEFNAMDERAPWKGDIHQVGRIPLNKVAELERLGIWRDDEALRRWLNDPENRAFRTRPGKL